MSASSQDQRGCGHLATTASVNGWEGPLQLPGPLHILLPLEVAPSLRAETAGNAGQQMQSQFSAVRSSGKESGAQNLSSMI